MTKINLAEPKIEKQEEKKEKGIYYVVLPLSRVEMRAKECRTPDEVGSYTRRNNFHNFWVFYGKDVTRNFRR